MGNSDYISRGCNLYIVEKDNDGRNDFDTCERRYKSLQRITISSSQSRLLVCEPTDLEQKVKEHSANFKEHLVSTAIEGSGRFLNCSCNITLVLVH